MDMEIVKAEMHEVPWVGVEIKLDNDDSFELILDSEVDYEELEKAFRTRTGLITIGEHEGAWTHFHASSIKLIRTLPIEDGALGSKEFLSEESFYADDWSDINAPECVTRNRFYVEDVVQPHGGANV